MPAIDVPLAVSTLPDLHVSVHAVRILNGCFSRTCQDGLQAYAGPRTSVLALSSDKALLIRDAARFVVIPDQFLFTIVRTNC